MSELLRHPAEEFNDWLQLVFRDVEFSPVAEDALDDFVMSGSERMLGGYDPVAGCHVDVLEMYGVLAEDDGLKPSHRLVAWWDNGADAELDLDTGEILLGDIEDESPDGISAAHARLRQALASVEGDRNGR